MTTHNEHAPESAPNPDNTLPAFTEKTLTGAEPLRCVDGRPASPSEQGAQLPGGVLFPVILSAIHTESELNHSFLTGTLASLQTSGLPLGVHTGSHMHEGSSDCGFADKMPTIIKKAQLYRDEILRRITSVYQANQAAFDKETPGIAQNIQEAYDQIMAYDADQITVSGAEMVGTAITLGSPTERVEHDHKEQVAFLNLKEDTTLDTRRLNEQDQQGFNLDLWRIPSYANRLGIDPTTAQAQALILYVATEMVLVEDKGKTALQVSVHS